VTDVGSNVYLEGPQEMPQKSSSHLGCRLYWVRQLQCRGPLSGRALWPSPGPGAFAANLRLPPKLSTATKLPRVDAHGLVIGAIAS
jgi:hypothetical protein